MEQGKKIELLDQQIRDAKNGTPDDFNLWREKTSVVLRNVLGDSNPLYESFQAVRYTPSVFTTGTDFTPYKVAGVKRAIAVLEAAKVEVELAGGLPNPRPGTAAVGNSIFIVHGRDDAAKHEVARFLERLTDRQPTILHEQANNGRTLMEKFEQFAASTAYAVVLATPDDLGKAATGDELKPRARQNVIFELGFFFGALGRSRVALLYKEGIENPSDVDGLAYLPMDKAGAWKMQLARELEAAGVGVRWEALGN